MRTFVLQITLCFLFVSISFSAGYQPQNYGNDFMKSFNQTQEFMNQQRQREQIEEDRQYRNKRLRIEEQRLENERINAEKTRLENERIKAEAENEEKRQDNEWTAAIVKFHADHPEYITDAALHEKLKSELKNGSSETSVTYESKLNIFESAHNRLQVIEAKNAEKSKIWKRFYSENPEFVDEDSKHRKYGNYLFDTIYSNKIDSGEMSLTDALNLVAIDTYKTIGRKKDPPATVEKTPTKTAVQKAKKQKTK